jgi:glycosyltransferase involved in cell wall biosynthesis
MYFNNKNMTTKFTLIIPCYNAKNFLFSLISSIKNSALKPRQIIFVNDCSTDDTYNFLLKVKIKNIMIDVVSTPVNLGPGGARNYGVKFSKNENLMFVDADVNLKKNTTKIFIQKINKFNSIVGIYNYKNLNRGFFQEFKSYYYYFMLYKKFDYKYSIFSASCSGIKVNLFNKIRGYDDWFGKNKIDYENEDFGNRLKKHTDIWLVPEMQVYHFFPNNVRLFKTLFFRSSHWIEFFFFKQKEKFNFDEAGGTKLQATKCILSFISLFLLISNFFFFSNGLTFFFLTISLITYVINNKFLKFIKIHNRNRFKFFLGLIIFETVIVFGAFFGLLKILLKISKFYKK